MQEICFLNDNGDFSVENVDKVSLLYFPIASETGLKSAITPNLMGDSKLDQNHFVLEPTSIEDLRSSKAGRNFWINIKGEGYWSAAGNSAEAEMDRYSSDKDTVKLDAGFMWQKVERTSKKHGLKAEITSFVPHDKNAEVMRVVITNESQQEKTLTATAAIPLFGRSADNLRDHRHVTSLLHRIRTDAKGVVVKPTLSFDERGHQKNTFSYFVCGVDENSKGPVEFFPTVDSFVGQSSFLNPEAVAGNLMGINRDERGEGLEPIGAFKFREIKLNKNESFSYTLFFGATEDEGEIEKLYEYFSLNENVEKAFEENKEYWLKQVNISVKTKNKGFDGFMKWVCFQPILRRIYGCSFLPHHDYGKGGRGWRDLWQDCLALLIMNPDGVRKMILDNFSGVRVDGTNATIIGDRPGEFKADRNGITRVWMDHGMWPFLTTELYINQTGDLGLLNEKVKYFFDRQVMRGGSLLETANDKNTGYEGSVLEHMLLQHVAALCETGDHGIIKLRDADWNDALDMASKRGESVAFSCAYAGNLLKLSDYVEKLGQETKTEKISVMKELAELIEKASEAKNDKDKAFTDFMESVSYSFSGEKKEVEIKALAADLRKIANAMAETISNNEWVTDKEGRGWFNSYYDNNGRAVEGETKDGVRMMLTGQVFAIMSGIADEARVKAITESADKYLYDREIGGYKLNTNFYEEKYDMGRAFGFAYGHKENGAVFSHMAVMYANALYQRGFAEEGYKALQSLSDAALNFNKSKIFPGIPEYFDGEGRGLYHYLTGAASWYALTMVTEVFGVKGNLGDLHIKPALMKEQLDENNEAMIKTSFAGKELAIICHFEEKEKPFLQKPVKAYLDDEAIIDINSDELVLTKEFLASLSDNEHEVKINFK